MISNERLRELMLEAIKGSEKSVPEDYGVHPKVGAVLANRNGEVIARAHRGESGQGDHAEFLMIRKAMESGVDLSETALFVTLEPCTARGKEEKIPCSRRVVESGIPRIYIGMLDPNPLICGRGETYLRQNLEVERFPGDLVKQIEQSNTEFVRVYRAEHLPRTSLYVSTQISDLINDYLRRAGLDVSDLPFDWDVTVDDLAHYCSSAPSESAIADLLELVRNARGYAFDKKYADYTYDKDARGLGDYWQQEFREIMGLLRAADFPQRRIIDIGISNGLEGQGLFNTAEHLTIVDIAPNALERAKRLLPKATTLLANAEDLNVIRTGSQDMYVSLRTYQSSYFGISRAIREAYRIVRQGGLVVISIANGFIGEGGALIPGLVIPRTNTVDRNRPFEITEQIRRKLTLLRFEEVGVRTGLAEIYVYGRRTR